MIIRGTRSPVGVKARPGSHFVVMTVTVSWCYGLIMKVIKARDRCAVMITSTQWGCVNSKPSSRDHANGSHFAIGRSHMTVLEWPKCRVGRLRIRILNRNQWSESRNEVILPTPNCLVQVFSPWLIVDKKTVLHKNSAKRPASEVSSQCCIRAVPWRRNENSCREFPRHGIRTHEQGEAIDDKIAIFRRATLIQIP